MGLQAGAERQRGPSRLTFRGLTPPIRFMGGAKQVRGDGITNV